MITDEEERFLQYWEKNRDRDKKIGRQLLTGLPLGLMIGIGIIASIGLGWYERADMEANSQLSPIILIIAVIAIAVFTGVFYKKYKWDMLEQRYKELQYKKQKDKSNPDAA